MGSGSALVFFFFQEIRDQAVPFLSDQGPKFVTLGIKDQIFGYKRRDKRRKNIPRYDPVLFKNND